MALGSCLLLIAGELTEKNEVHGLTFKLLPNFLKSKNILTHNFEKNLSKKFHSYFHSGINSILREVI